jgi:L-asparaginase
MPIDIRHISFENPIDSSNILPKHWVKLVDIIEKHYIEYDGFLILHGTDTMAYTASALSFLLENLNKPVILTGSQLPLDMIRTDGRDNLIAALEIASAYKDDLPIVPEVAIYFENKLFRGNRTSKFNAENFDAFYSGNYPVLAQVGVHIKYYTEYINKPTNKPLKVYKKLDNSVGLIKIYPGMPIKILEDILYDKDLKLVILETFGTGNAPTYDEFLKPIKKAIEDKKVILNITQCKAGKVELGRYATSLSLENLGVISGADMTVESAITKSMFVLGNFTDKNQIIRLLQTSLRGEMTDNE